MTGMDSTSQISMLKYQYKNQRDSSPMHKNDRPFFIVGYKGARHLHPERLPLANRGPPQTVQLLDTAKNTLKCFLASSQDVHRFVATGLHLKSLPGDLFQGMEKIRNIDLGTNYLTNAGIPHSIGELKNLVELKLASNKIKSFPNCLVQLKNLKRLDLSDNALKSLQGIENLKKLQFLTVDNNNLESIFPHIKQLKHLQFLYCSRNNILQIEVDIQFLVSLRALEMADNRVASLPIELFNLPNLNSLNVNNNCISKLPNFNVRFRDKKWMECIDLSNNKISKFPEHLLLFAKRLDLDSNKIKMLNNKVLSNLNWNSDQELILKHNPLVYPPAEVCSGGLHSMLQFWADDQINKKTYQGIKIMVLGSCGSGKTSLVQSFVAQQSQLQETSDCIGGIDIYDITVDKQFEFTKKSSGNIESLQLSIWDFCGDYTDFNFHYLFYQRPSITLLCFNVFEYKMSQDFTNSIGWWLDWIISRTNQLIVVLVATHSDLVDSDELLQIIQRVRRETKLYLRGRKKSIENEINLISQNPHISAALSKQLKSYVDLLQAQISIAYKIVWISSMSMSGFSDLYAQIESLALDKRFFPNVSRVIPTFWVEVGNFLEEQGNSAAIPVLEWDRYTTLVASKFGMKHLICSISQYLHDMGKIFWFSKHQQLKNYVFLRPSWVTDIFRQIMSAASGQFLEKFQENSPNKTKMFQNRLEDMTALLSDKGILTHELLKIILSKVISTATDECIDKIMNLLSKAFEVGYLLQKNTPKTSGSSQSGTIRKYADLFIPLLQESSVVTQNLESFGSLGIAVAFQFKKSIPVGIFELLICRLYRSQEFSFKEHWRDGVHLKCSYLDASIVVVRQAAITVIESGNLHASIKIASLGNQLETEELVALWKPILSIVMEIERIMESFPGEFVKRLVVCPFCEELVFTGEWHSPRERQNMALQTCLNCLRDVPTYFLIQPKEQTRADLIRQNLKELREQKKTDLLQKTEENAE